MLALFCHLTNVLAKSKRCSICGRTSKDFFGAGFYMNSIILKYCNLNRTPELAEWQAFPNNNTYSINQVSALAGSLIRLTHVFFPVPSLFRIDT